jgi:amino acid permease
MGMKSIGPRFALCVDVCIFVNGLLGSLAYVILVCDFFQESIPAVLGVHFARWQLVMLDTFALILPLSYLKDLSPLRIPSMIALLIIAFIFIYVVQDWLGNFSHSLTIFKGAALHCNLGIFFATSVYTGAFSAHYNAPTFYRELGQDLAAYTRVVRQSFTLAFMMYALFAIAGYGTWGERIEGNLLKNYGEHGGAAIELATLLMGFSITLSFPLVFNSGRAAFYGVFPIVEKAREESPDTVHLAVTTVLVLGICSAACFIKDVQVVVGLAGALLQTPICFTIPGIVYWKISRSQPTLPLQGREPIARSKLLMVFSILLVAFGLQNQVVGSLVVLDII